MRPIFLLALFCVACDPASPCADGEIRHDGVCEAYTPADPAPYTGWRPAPGVTWQWQITGALDASWDVDVYDVDVFDLTAQGRADLGDRPYICYFSAGSYEPWRDDAGRYPDEAIGRPLDGWPDERWVDTTDSRVRAILLDRLDYAQAQGCWGVEPDNVTAHHNNTGFGITYEEQLDFNRFLADAAHERGMAVALKNDTGQIEDLLPWFDLTVNEECMAWDECDTLQPFLDDDKAALHAEYVDDWADAADKADEVCGAYPGLSTIIKTWDLGPEWLGCP